MNNAVDHGAACPLVVYSLDLVGKAECCPSLLMKRPRRVESKQTKTLTIVVSSFDSPDPWNAQRGEKSGSLLSSDMVTNCHSG